MPTGGDAQKRYVQNRQHQQQAKIKAAKKASAGSVAGSKTAGRIKGGDLFNRSKSPPGNLANQKQKGVAGAKTAGRIKGEDLFKRPQQVAQSQPPQQEVNRTTTEDVANRTTRAAASGVQTGAAAVETGAKVAQGAAAGVQGAAAGAQAAAKGTEAAAKGAQVAAKGIGAASQATGAASKGLMSAGQALSSTGLGAIVGVPLMALGGAGTAASAGGKVAAKGGEAAAKGAEKGAKAAGEVAKKTKEGAKKVKEGAKKVKEGAQNVREKAKQTKGALDQKHAENKEDKPDNAPEKMGSEGIMQIDKIKARSKDNSLASQLLNDHKRGGKDAFDQAELNLKRKAALHTSRLAEKIGQQNKAKALAATSSQLSPNAKGSKAGLEGMAPTDRLQQNRRTQFLERGIMARNARQQAQANKTSATAGETDDKRDELKKQAKAGARRGLIYLVSLLSNGVKAGTGGLGFFLTILIDLFSLAWLNLEMVYGKWIAKGQSKYIAPISWAPFKIPVDQNAFMLQVAIVTADVALATSVAVVMFGSVCFAYDYMILLATPFDFAAAIAAGGEGLCLGGIIHSIVTGL